MRNISASELATRIARVRGEAETDRLARDPTDEPAPLSSQQQRLWFLHELTVDTSAFNLSRAIRVRGNLDVAALRDAIAAVAARHCVLRARFSMSSGTPLQTFDCGAHSTGYVELDTDEKQLHEFVKAEARKPFDLETGPPFRSTLLRIAPDDHVLLLTLHHIAADRWSLGVLLHEISDNYGHVIRGDLPRFTQPDIRYSDYARWQRAQLGGPASKHAFAYWASVLSGPLPLTEFPPDRQSPRNDVVMESCSVRLDSERTDALRSLARAENATLFMTLLAVFSVLLYRYTGQDDAVVGVPIAGRGVPEIEELIGLFVNAVPLRIRIDGDASFLDLLRAVRNATLRAYDYQDIPYEALIEALRPARTTAGSPFFQTLFALQNTPTEDFCLDQLTTEVFSGSTAATTFDFNFVTSEDPDGLLCVVEYNALRYDGASVERILHHFANLVSAALADPSIAVGELELFNDEERARVVGTWNRTTAEFPAELRIHELFAERARLTPLHVAVSDDDGALTYGELDDLSDRLAAYLRSRGGSEAECIGVCMSRSVRMVVAVVAILKAGAACVPLDPSNPPRRLRFMVEKAAPRLILAETRTREALPSVGGVAVVDLDRESAAFARAGERAPVSAGDGRSLAYILFTSGSTGEPQGVMLEHRGFVNYLKGAATYGICPDDRVLQFMALGFDVSVGEIWSTLCAGATLCLRNDEMISSPERFMERCAELGITVLILPTVYFHELGRALERKRLLIPPELRMLAFAGEAVHSNCVRAWLQNGGEHVRLMNHYGPTEATIAATTYDCNAFTPGDAENVAIGKPIANMRCYILDSHLRPVPVGAIGELYLAGVGLARGYLENPRRTAERFLPDPFSSDPTERMYKTGDLGRYRSDGAIEFLGRTDHQVKIRGFRIELGEVEAALARHPAVRESAVIAQENATGDKRLVAYVALNHGATIQHRELRGFLSQTLPEYMHPAKTVVVDRFPLTPSGKIDRRVLSAAESDTGSHERFVEPIGYDPSALNGHVVNLLEAQLAELFGDILGLQNFGIDDDFFEHGGHSLQAARLVARIQEICGERVTMKALFEASTPQRLSDRIIEALPTPSSPLLRIQEGSKAAPLFFLYGDLYGSGIYVRQLAHALREFGICTLPPHGTNGTPALETVEAMAADYAALIEREQPNGPYFLAGYCNGGVVAYEMARLLRARGARVGPVVLIASPAYNTAFTKVRSAVRWMGRLLGWSPDAERLWFQRIRQRAIQVSLLRGAPASAYARFAMDNLRAIIHKVNDAPATADARDVELLSPYQRMADVLAGYFPGCYDGPVHLVWGIEDKPIIRDPTAGWGAVASDLTVHSIPGDHHTMVTVESDELARIIRTVFSD